MSERDATSVVIDMHNVGKNKLEIASELSLQGWVFYDALEFTESVYERESFRDPIRMGSSLDDMRKQPPIDI
ncbi:hypothetical protein [Enterovibrio nigricans]|uniref:Uncharacterized protein n=1 Tax=Enterovibrio nigricans DSM 22720 TaxID=1121868 RepID=A0A1T4VSW5_9GAMM|nr:hypothetical protein [Enterovibrio nigricans]PKF49125.1 hypothetical protein AT251_21230 [Enterovibrio nigricans]SKA68063.1 hypothetical protein SAMN02745132_04261 [Enterovibrio nigricans DSM 22720]